jgi:hypothetical protein
MIRKIYSIQSASAAEPDLCYLQTGTLFPKKFPLVQRLIRREKNSEELSLFRHGPRATPMPRQSSAALSVAIFSASFGRLQPRPTLGGLERELFVSIVASLPPDHFEPADVVLVSAFARSAAMEQRSGETLQANPNDSDALAMHGSAVRSLASLALRLRL